MKKILIPALSLTVICLVTALLLSSVNVLTASRIAQNLEQAERQAMEEVFGEGISYSDISDPPAGIKRIFEVKKNGSLAGYSVSVSPNGFGGNIDMVVGVAPDGSIIGVAITSLSETPGLGSRVAEPEYLDKFDGLSGKLVLNSDVDAISGATISSRSVLTGVNSALDALRRKGCIEYRK